MTRERNQRIKRPAKRWEHGEMMQISTFKGRSITIRCPRCNRPTDRRYWHESIGHGICESCWEYTTRDFRPMALNDAR